MVSFVADFLTCQGIGYMGNFANITKALYLRQLIWLLAFYAEEFLVFSGGNLIPSDRIFLLMLLLLLAHQILLVFVNIIKVIYVILHILKEVLFRSIISCLSAVDVCTLITLILLPFFHWLIWLQDLLYYFYLFMRAEAILKRDMWSFLPY